MAQNVLVCCRFRPPSQREIEEEAEKAIFVGEDNKTCRVELPGMTKKNSFNFDYVFDTNATQLDVFTHTAQPMVKEIMNGYNTTIFAYGQTGAGKTFTMMGDRSHDTNKGIIPRLVEAIFDAINEADENIEFTIKLSYLEIYNEKLKDLLNPEQDNLRIRESTTAGVWVQDVTESYISSYDEVLEVMAAGEKYRSIAATKMNQESSRSHSVFIFTLGQLNQKTGSRKGSKLTLVDLAGSEKVQKTGAEGQTLKEAQHINKSLSALGNVINALTSKSKHIPYRDSKLTRLLSDSLGGNSKTCLIIACSPGSTNAEETLSTLRFGSRAKQIKNKPTVNQEKSVAEYKRLLAAAMNTIKSQKEFITALESDVDSLLNCLNSIPQQYLTTPIPVLKSKKMSEYMKSQAQVGTEEIQEMIEAENISRPGSVSGLSSGGSVSESTVLSDAGDGEEDDDEDGESDVKTLTDSPRKKGYDEKSQRQEREADERLNGLEYKDADDLREQIRKLQLEKQDLLELMNDKKREIEELQGELNLKKKELEQETKDKASGVEEQSDMRERLVIAEEKSIQLDLLQKKMALMEKEHQLETDQLKADKEELARKLGQVTDEKTDPMSPKVVQPSTPTTNERQLLELQAEMKRLRSNYEAIMRALKKKCDQYMHLQIIHQDTKEVLLNTENALSVSNKKLADGAAQKKIKDLEARLAKSEEICAKLFESGMYWRQRRFTKDNRKIRVPIKGGGKKKGKKKNIATITDEESISDLSEAHPSDSTLDTSTSANSNSASSTSEDVEHSETSGNSASSTATSTVPPISEHVPPRTPTTHGKIRVGNKTKPESRMDTFF